MKIILLCILAVGMIGLMIPSVFGQTITEDGVKTLIVRIPEGAGSSPECEESSMCYLPWRATINQGEQIKWMNKDNVGHTITTGTPSSGPNGIFDSSLIKGGYSLIAKFDFPIKTDYFCMVHPWMSGKINVVETESPSTSQEITSKQLEPVEKSISNEEVKENFSKTGILILDNRHPMKINFDETVLILKDDVNVLRISGDFKITEPTVIKQDGSKKYLKNLTALRGLFQTSYVEASDSKFYGSTYGETYPSELYSKTCDDLRYGQYDWNKDEYFAMCFSLPKTIKNNFELFHVTESLEGCTPNIPVSQKLSKCVTPVTLLQNVDEISYDDYITRFVTHDENLEIVISDYSKIEKSGYDIIQLNFEVTNYSSDPITISSDQLSLITDDGINLGKSYENISNVSIDESDVNEVMKSLREGENLSPELSEKMKQNIVNDCRNSTINLNPLITKTYQYCFESPKNHVVDTFVYQNFDDISLCDRYDEDCKQNIVKISPKSLTVASVDTPSSENIIEDSSSSEGGGCLIATAAFGSEMAPQVQFLREIRDNTVLQTTSGTTFMNGFNQFYYSFSPQIADYERENPVFKEVVKVSLAPLLTSLTLLNYVEIDSEEEMLGYGISIILLNIGMYFVVPAILVISVKKVIFERSPK